MPEDLGKKFEAALEGFPVKLDAGKKISPPQKKETALHKDPQQEVSFTKFATDREGAALRTRLNRDKKEALLMVMAAWNVLKTYLPALEDQLKQIKNGWRDARLIQSGADRILDRVLDVCDMDTLTAIQNTLAHSHVRVVPRAVGKTEGGWFVLDDDLMVMIDALLTGTCMMCDKDAGQQRACMVRRVLNRLPIQERFLESATGCPYAVIPVSPDE